MVSNKNKYKINYFFAEPEQNVDMKSSAEVTQSIDYTFKDVFTGIDCFKLSSLQVKAGQAIPDTSEM